MPWSLKQQFDVTNSADYKNRVNQSFLRTAIAVKNESDQTPNHTKRLAFAEAVLSGSGMPVRAPQLLPTLNPDMQYAENQDSEGIPTDSSIEFTVSQQWNYFAGEE